MNFIKFIILICLSLLSIDGYTQGQITRRPTMQKASRRIKASSSNTVNRKKGYVNLELPSGTLWKDTNESDLFDYNKAMRKFGGNLPNKEQWDELRNYCTWSWEGSGLKVTGPNGNTIVLPAAGCQYNGGELEDAGSWGYYWTSTPQGSLEGWYFYFNSHSSPVISTGNRSHRRSVRLIRNLQ